MKFYKLLVLFFASLLFPSILIAQLPRTKQFREQYRLQQVVVLSRHNIRSPLSDYGSALARMTPHAWTEWTSAPSELTLRGGLLETMMGQFFRQWLVQEQMFCENTVPTIDELNIYANSMQRTIATAQYFSTGFLPVANLRVYHRFNVGKMDPVFFPRLTKVSDAFRAKAMAQIAEMGGKNGIKGISEKLKGNYALMAKVLGMTNSIAYKKGEIKGFRDDDTEIIFNLDEEPQMRGTLKLANSASDAFILQYYEELDSVNAAFGHSLTLSDWEKIAKIKDVYGDVLFTAPIVAVNVAHPLLVYIDDELQATHRKFTFLCGHDSNIASVCAALGVEPYELPQSIEKKTPIGGKLVFEKWVDKDGKQYVALNMVYQSTRQLRNIEMLSLQCPPMVYPLRLTGLKTNIDGLYVAKEVEHRFKEAINAYDDIR